MGTYNLSPEELVPSLRKYLQSHEGDVIAESLAQAWNTIAIQEGWHDRLQCGEDET